MSKVRRMENRLTRISRTQPARGLLTSERAAEFHQLFTLARSYTSNPTELQDLQTIQEQIRVGASEIKILAQCRHLPIETQHHLSKALELLIAEKQRDDEQTADQR